MSKRTIRVPDEEGQLRPRHCNPVASLPALGLWAPPAKRGISLESIYRVSLTVDLCEGNKIISLKKIFTTASFGRLKKKKNPGALGTCLVCPLVKTALTLGAKTASGLYYSFGSDLLKKYATDLRRFFSSW